MNDTPMTRPGCETGLVCVEEYTPRTNAACEAMSVNHTEAWPKVVPVEFARKLEVALRTIGERCHGTQLMLGNDVHKIVLEALK